MFFAMMQHVNILQSTHYQKSQSKCSGLYSTNQTAKIVDDSGLHVKITQNRGRGDLRRVGGFIFSIKRMHITTTRPPLM